MFNSFSWKGTFKVDSNDCATVDSDCWIGGLVVVHLALSSTCRVFITKHLMCHMFKITVFLSAFIFYFFFALHPTDINEMNLTLKSSFVCSASPAPSVIISITLHKTP